ncbi:MAG: hypothetical protein ACTSUQ_01715 [Candidatus Freyarchaeota archaeon]
MAETEEEPEKLREWLLSKSFDAELYSPRNPRFVAVDSKKGIEIKVWLKPDGIVLDQETLRRRKRAELDNDLEAWTISPEDFTVNKLARPDRGAVDEQDVKSVLTRQRQARRRLPQKKSQKRRSAQSPRNHPKTMKS